MNDPSTYWLTLTNVALGAVTLICLVAVAAGVLQEVAARRKKAAAASRLDEELASLVAGMADAHAFRVPGLGITMADGGEEVSKKKETR